MAEVAGTDLSYLRLLVARPEGPARLGALSWSETDPSVYLFPPAGYRRYRYGLTEPIGPGDNQVSMDRLPHSCGVVGGLRVPTGTGAIPSSLGSIRWTVAAGAPHGQRSPARRSSISVGALMRPPLRASPATPCGVTLARRP